jgi:antirestriction protein ArdC
VKDEAGSSATERARVALLHITDTSRLLKLLKDDSRAVFTAAAKASEAVAYLKRLQASSP